MQYQIDYELKTEPKYFNAVWRGKKLFEIRYNDRDFKSGQIVKLRKYSRLVQKYNQRYIIVKVVYVCHYPQGLQPGFIVFGLQVLEKGGEWLDKEVSHST